MSPIETRALDFVREEIVNFGASPGYREIAAAIGVSVTNSYRVITRLVEAGYLRRAPRRKRSLALVALADLRTTSTEAMRAELARRGVSLDALERGEPRALAKGAVSCAADCCQLEVQPGELFCRNHWYQLPRALRAAIFAAWRRRDRDAYQRLVTEARDRIDAPRHGIAA